VDVKWLKNKQKETKDTNYLQSVFNLCSKLFLKKAKNDSQWVYDLYLELAKS
jgi:hypothetical protein